MVQPSPVLCARVRFSTKQVGFGFYRGNKTGSVGAHTQYGGYLIDWRKVRNYAVPDLTKFQLTPYVTEEIKYKADPIEDEVELSEEHKKDVLTSRAMPFLENWKSLNYTEFTDFVTDQHTQLKDEKLESERDQGEQVLQGTSTPITGSSQDQDRVSNLRGAMSNLAAQELDSHEIAAQETAEEEARWDAEAREESLRQMQEQEEAKIKAATRKRQSMEAAMKNTPREFTVGKMEKQKRSTAKELRKHVKKTTERHEKEAKREVARGGVDGAIRFAAYQEAFRERARRMAEKLS